MEGSGNAGGAGPRPLSTGGAPQPASYSWSNTLPETHNKANTRILKVIKRNTTANLLNDIIKNMLIAKKVSNIHYHIIYIII